MNLHNCFKYLLFIGFVTVCPSGLAVSGETPALAKQLTVGEFTRLAATKDTEFETILIDELIVNYQKDLKLPAGDLVLSVKQQYDFFIEQDRDAPATEISLSRLFPQSGTEVALAYDVGASLASSVKASKLSFNVSQPIARNAFGRSTKLLDKIVGLEMDVARHQIVEAYEDYLAAITAAYYNWYEDYRNLEIGRSSYVENLKLLDDIRKRQAQNIALPIDVNKVELQVLAKKENVLELEEKLKTSLQLIRTVIRYEGNEQLEPVESAVPVSLAGSFEKLFEQFSKESRTFQILKKLAEKSSLQVARDADDLFPSINLIAGYEIQGEDYGLENSSDVISAGVSFRFPFGNQVEKAEYEVSKVLADKSKLETQNTWYRLYAQLTGLYLQIERESKLIKIADEKIGLARAIVKDETENYSFGKVTLNDYIQAVNVLDSNRFNKVLHESRHRKLLIEWLRLMDRLVSRKEIKGLP
ncbi:MAG: TolC family protein [Thermodesulfobacteriota bacterium]